jgi:thioredoxin
MSVKTLNVHNINEVIFKSQKPVLIDFWANWCGPCKMQSPIVDDLAEEMEDKAIVAKLDIDENPELAAQFSVMSIPTLIVLKNGRMVMRKTGLTPKKVLSDALTTAMD